MIFIDAIQVKVRRQTVENEAFYVVLWVTTDRRREVLAITHQSVENATGWQIMLEQLHRCGLQQVGLVVADGLIGLPSAVGRIYPQAVFQRCVTL